MTDDRVAEAFAGSQAFLPPQDPLTNHSTETEAVSLAKDVIQRNTSGDTLNKSQAIGELDLLKQALQDTSDKKAVDEIIDKIN